MNANDFVLVALQLATMLAFALALGQLMRRFRQPAVLGEMIGGIIVGPTVFGAVAPDLYLWLFGSSVNAALVRDSAVKLGMLFFLYIAGSEIDLSDLRRSGPKALSIGLVGTLIPIAVGVGLVYAIPASYWGDTAAANLLPFGLFIGMNLANSANPVLARILMDLGLMRTRLGTLSMAATVVDDLVNWTLFAVVLSTMSITVGGAPAAGSGGSDLWVSIALVLLLFAVTLGGLRAIAPKLVHFARTKLTWPSGFIAFTALLILGAAAVSDGVGVHAFLGAFLVGAAMGGHGKEQEEAHEVITQFSLSFFAPIFFVSMGMAANFITNFDLGLVVIVTVVAFTSKLGAVLLGARIVNMPLDRNTWAIGFGLNARGATGIILAGVGLTAGVIDERVFVGIVVMALITSIVAGPAMNALLDVRHAGAASGALDIDGYRSADDLAAVRPQS